ncbi:hypothetical protein LCGC14_0377070 [marine sediment metagenome]|uniref:Uncharacterized protein n=1 Tax=marine sediment metagenome TaxID=412755 RepID=A0A0F9VQU8_9ZZZZ
MPDEHTPTTQFHINICQGCLDLEGEMCDTPECIFCRRTMKEVSEYLDVLLIRPVIDGVQVEVIETYNKDQKTVDALVTACEELSGDLCEAVAMLKGDSLVAWESTMSRAQIVVAQAKVKK